MDGTLKVKLLKTLDAYSAFCDAHGLRYFSAYGTAIGVIRHKGFIPWDDDIDVFMPRVDYDRMMALRYSAPKPYKIVDIGEIGYTASFAKFMDMDTSIWEIKQIPYVLGVYVDIFPLDNCGEDASFVDEKLQFNRLFQRYFRSLYKWGTKELLYMLFNGNLRRFLSSSLTNIYYGRKTELYHRKMLAKLMEIKKNGDSDYYISTCSFPFEKCVYKKEWFSDSILMDFENTSIKVPVGYEEYLRYSYGDYMQLPPVNERQSHHERFYVNLEEGLSINEIKKKIKQKDESSL